MFYILYISNFKETHDPYVEYYVLDTLLDLIYSRYNISCDNLNTIINIAYGHVIFAYFTFKESSYYLCDPSSIVDLIELKGDHYEIRLKSGNIYSAKVESDETRYVVIVGSDNDKLYIREGTLK